MEHYEPIRSVAPNLYCVDSDWQDSPMRRRMTVVVLSTGELVLHSAVWMKEADLKALEGLGSISYVLVPNVFHGSEAAPYAERYPNAKILVPQSLVSRLKRKYRVNGSFETDWPAEVAQELSCIPVQGTRLLCESIFIHKPSGTLITTDLVFNLGDIPRGMLRVFLKWNESLNCFGPSKIFRWVFMRDRDELAGSLQEAYRIGFDRIIMSHGEIVESGGKQKLVSAFAPIIKG